LSIEVDRSDRQKFRKGSAMLECAVVAPVLILLLAGTVTVGMSLIKTFQIGQVCHNANLLVVRGEDLSSPANQQLVLQAASGLGMTPAGRSAVILTKVIRVGPEACKTGIANWDQNPATCMNYGSYVIASRITIGNVTRWISQTGNPHSACQANGTVTAVDIATENRNRASNFPAIISLGLDEFVYISEAFADTAEFSLLRNILPPVITVRNLS
jgi:Flp pilus assembly protein TadG